MYSDGYKYWLAYSKNNISYYRCSRYKLKCPGRCVMEDGQIRSTTPHTHNPEPDRVLVEKFRKILTHRAATESTDLYGIYWDEASQRHSDAAMLYTFNAAESAMRKARRRQLPPVPNTIEELGEVLANSNLFRIHSGQNKDQFYQTTLILDGTSCLIFAHMKTLSQIKRVEEMHLDASIKMTTQNPTHYYLLTVHSVQSFISIPILYIIMTNKTQMVFAAVFAYIREHFSAYVAPNVVITNFDTDMQTAIAYTFPEATIKGYWFQYTDAVLNEVQQLGLQSETARGHGSSCLRMLLVLPLLPADYMMPGLEAVKKCAQEKKILTPPMNQLCSYIEHSWLRAVGADKMSIFGLPHSIYNHIQHFNKDLNSSLETGTFWHMLETITYMATRTFVKIKKRLKMLSSNEPPKKGQQVSDRIINDATQLWIRTPVHLRSPLHFLQLTSHCINDSIYQNSIDGMKKTKQNSTINDSMVGKPNKSPSMSTVSKSQFTDLPNDKSVYMNGQKYQLQTPSNQISNHHHHQQQSSTLNQCNLLQNASPPQISKPQISNDPPPLAFFPKSKPVATTKKRLIPFPSEPPPLVRIRQS